MRLVAEDDPGAFRERPHQRSARGHGRQMRDFVRVYRHRRIVRKGNNNLATLSSPSHHSIPTPSGWRNWRVLQGCPAEASGQRATGLGLHLSPS
jgi:hypothetical protein